MRQFKRLKELKQVPEEVELELVDMSKKYNMELDKLKELLVTLKRKALRKTLKFKDNHYDCKQCTGKIIS